MIRRFIARQALKRATGGKIETSRVQALVRLPTLLRLTLALLRDKRVPVWQRAGTLGLVTLIMSPIDLPGNIPILGQFWDFTLAVTVLDTFIAMAPRDVVNEHIRALRLENRIPLRER